MLSKLFILLESLVIVIKYEVCCSCAVHLIAVANSKSCLVGVPVFTPTTTSCIPTDPKPNPKQSIMRCGMRRGIGKKLLSDT